MSQTLVIGSSATRLGTAAVSWSAATLEPNWTATGGTDFGVMQDGSNSTYVSCPVPTGGAAAYFTASSSIIPDRAAVTLLRIGSINKTTIDVPSGFFYYVAGDPYFSSAGYGDTLGAFYSDLTTYLTYSTTGKAALAAGYGVSGDEFIGLTTYFSSEFAVELTFTLPVPTAGTGTANSVLETMAQLRGTVNPSTANATYPVTTYFQWGTSADLSDATSTSPQTVTGDGPQDFSVDLTDLTAGTTYYYRIVASTIETTVNGNIVSFTTYDGTSNELTAIF